MIETERLLLREYTPDDFDALYEIMSDPETMQHYPAPFDEARTRRWIEWNIENYGKYGFGLWAVVLKETGEFIGDCGITIQKIDGENLPEIGYHIHKKYWRRGFAKEAAQAVRDWAFENTDYPALYSYCKYTNEASYKTAEAIGMHLEKEYQDEANKITHVSVIHRKAMPEFKKITDFPRGTIYDILCDAYSYDERNKGIWDADWKEAEDFFYDNPEIADKYGLVTCIGGEPIGFVTWDPRNRPEYVEIGHNGIREKYKRQGYGHKQLEEAVRRIKEYHGLKRIIVCTNSNLAAPKNYESVGFTLYDRKPNETESAYTGDYLYYEIMLKSEMTGGM